MILIHQHKIHKSTKIFAENSLSLKNVKKMLYLMKPNIIKKSKSSIPVAARAKNTFTAKKTLNQKNLKKLQKLLLVILKKPQLL